MHEFDRIILTAFKPPPVQPGTAPVGTSAIGEAAGSRSVRALLATLQLDEDDLDDGACPEEITRLTVPLGITLYFRDLPLSSKNTKGRGKVRHLSAITYKRRGDLESNGFHGELPFGFEFGDSPQRLIAKAGEPRQQVTSPTTPNSNNYCPAHCKTGCLKVIWLTSSTTPWTA